MYFKRIPIVLGQWQGTSILPNRNRTQYKWRVKIQFTPVKNERNRGKRAGCRVWDEFSSNEKSCVDGMKQGVFRARISKLLNTTYFTIALKPCSTSWPQHVDSERISEGEKNHGGSIGTLKSSPFQSSSTTYKRQQIGSTLIVRRRSGRYPLTGFCFRWESFTHFGSSNTMLFSFVGLRNSRRCRQLWSLWVRVWARQWPCEETRWQNLGMQMWRTFISSKTLWTILSFLWL